MRAGPEGVRRIVGILLIRSLRVKLLHEQPCHNLNQETPDIEILTNNPGSPSLPPQAFFDPDSEATVAVHPRFVAAGEEPKYPPLTSGEFLLMMLRASKL